MGFPKGASIPFGQARGLYPAREMASFIALDYNVAPMVFEMASAALAVAAAD